MRVTFSRHEERKGSQNHYYVITEVQLTEEEKAIIRERSLYRETAFLTQKTADRNQAPIVTHGLMQSASRILAMAGFVALFFSGSVAFLLFATAIGIFVFRQIDRRNYIHSGEVTAITARKLLEQTTFREYAGTTLLAVKVREEENANHLAAFKKLLTESTTIDGPKTIEL